MIKETIHKAIIIVPAGYSALLYKSEPCLIKGDIFDGIFLEDNIYSEAALDKIPAETGIYSCNIYVHSSRDWTTDGYEYDLNIWVEDIKLIELNLL